MCSPTTCEEAEEAKESEEAEKDIMGSDDEDGLVKQWDTLVHKP